jgi:hypothetical protein
VLAAAAAALTSYTACDSQKPQGKKKTDGQTTAGTNPIHNKKPKKKPAADLDEEDVAFKAKQMAGAYARFALPFASTYPAFHSALSCCVVSCRIKWRVWRWCNADGQTRLRTRERGREKGK